jgi:hypothetical protein
MLTPFSGANKCGGDIAAAASAHDARTKFPAVAWNQSGIECE